MADPPDAEIEAIKLKIDNLLVAAQYRGLPQAATVAYLKEIQVLRQRLHELGGEAEGVHVGVHQQSTPKSDGDKQR